MTAEPRFKAKRKKAKVKSTFRRVVEWLHLWLGLFSGIIVFIVCITACVWAFNEDIRKMIEPEIKVKYENIPVITPSQIQNIVQQKLPDSKIMYADYLQGRAIYAGAGNHSERHFIIKIHPYTGAILAMSEYNAGETELFRVILNGHRFLWLPPRIGRPLVNYATLIFVVILITGLIWWYPKKWNKTGVKKSFTIRWTASFRRLNIDLHNVFGFYAMIGLLVMALTGMVWGIEWFNRGTYWISSGGRELPEWVDASSDSTKRNKNLSLVASMDLAWNKVLTNYPESQGFYYQYPKPEIPTSVIRIYVYPNRSQFYNAQTFTFDRYTLATLPGDGVEDVRYDEASPATKLRKMNFDLHVGSIFGLPGQILAFFCTLIGASLPVTGFIIWWKKRKKAKTSKVQLE